ncbi:MAG: N(4)-(beta-N-acetylglucosaminyl)-L-asparaginase [Ignavibacteria bacterium]|nr:N(4)-(beta-N-acetylglucosaminyl)-L-asparaginase [Ignavibacteria bacterium]
MEQLVISTWKHGMAANEKANEILNSGGSSLDAVEQGVRVAEDDPNVLSVGYGGLPDAEGRVTLDAAIMDWKARIGSVICVEHIKNPVSVARLILENTEHVSLAGEGAYNFAITNGFQPDILHTEGSIKKYIEWKNGRYGRSQEFHTDEYKVKKTSGLGINDDGNHDTIGMVAIDNDGHISASCTTSGTAWKLHGRVGDSPIIGAGLYVDGEVGGAASTGRGEECVRACGSFLVVEMMGRGMSPQEACEYAVKRVIKLNLLSHKNRDHDYQVGFVAVNVNGEFGAASVREGFEFALYAGGKNTLNKSKYIIDEKFVIEDL